MLRFVPRTVVYTARLSSHTPVRLFRSTPQTEPTPSAKVESVVKSTTGFGVPCEDDFDPALVAQATESEQDVRADHGPNPKGAGKTIYLNWEEVQFEDSFAAFEASEAKGKQNHMHAGK